MGPRIFLDPFENPDYVRFLATQKPKSAPKTNTKKGSGNQSFLSSLISEGGAVGGAVAGQALIPIPILGAAIGGFAGGTLGRLTENKVRDDEYRLGDALGEGALSGVFAGGPIALGKVAKGAATGGKAGLASALQAAERKGGQLVANKSTDAARTSISGKVRDVSNRELASQYGTISKPVARQTNPMQTVSDLADVGIFKPQEAEKIAGAITGGNGILSRAVVKATGRAGRVDTSTLRNVFNDALENNGVVGKEAKQLRTFFEAQMNKLAGGPKGSIAAKADPSDSLSVLKRIEQQMANLGGRGGNHRLATPERLDQSRVLGLVRDELEDQLYTKAGANANISKVLTPAVRKELVDLAPKNKQWVDYVDNTIMKTTDVKQLRSIQSPFVNVSKMIDEADMNAFTFGGRMTNAAGIREALANAATQGVRAPAARAGAKALRAPRNLSAGQRSIKGLAARVGAANLAEALLMPQPVDANTQALEGEVMPPQGQPDTMAQAPLVQGGMAAPAQQTGVGADSPFAMANVEQNVQSILANGGDFGDVEDYISLVTALQELNSGPAGPKLNATQIQQQNNAYSALADLQTLSQMINEDPGVMKRASIPGGQLARSITGTMGFETAKQNIVDVIARLRSGAAITEDEARRYMSMLPSYADTQQSANDKIQRLGMLLSGFAEPQAAQPEYPQQYPQMAAQPF